MTTIIVFAIAGLLYLVAGAACYPIYRRLGGGDSFEEYIGKL